MENNDDVDSLYDAPRTGSDGHGGAAAAETPDEAPTGTEVVLWEGGKTHDQELEPATTDDSNGRQSAGEREPDQDAGDSPTAPAGASSESEHERSLWRRMAGRKQKKRGKHAKWFDDDDGDIDAPDSTEIAIDRILELPANEDSRRSETFFGGSVLPIRELLPPSSGGDEGDKDSIERLLLGATSVEHGPPAPADPSNAKDSKGESCSAEDKPAVEQNNIRKTAFRTSSPSGSKKVTIESDDEVEIIPDYDFSISDISDPDPFPSIKTRKDETRFIRKYRGRKRDRTTPTRSPSIESSSSAVARDDRTLLPEDSSSRPPPRRRRTQSERSFPVRKQDWDTSSGYQSNWRGYIVVPQGDERLEDLSDVGWTYTKRIRMRFSDAELHNEAYVRRKGKSALRQYLALPNDTMREWLDRTIDEMQPSAASNLSSTPDWTLVCADIEDNKLIMILQRPPPPLQPYPGPYQPYWDTQRQNPPPPPPPFQRPARSAPYTQSRRFWWNSSDDSEDQSYPADRTRRTRLYRPRDAPSPPPQSRPSTAYEYDSAPSVNSYDDYPYRRSRRTSYSAYKPTSTISHRYPVNSDYRDASLREDLSRGARERRRERSNADNSSTMDYKDPLLYYDFEDPLYPPAPRPTRVPRRGPSTTLSSYNRANDMASEAASRVGAASAAQVARSRPLRQGFDRDEIINFKDCLGRDFKFPWFQARSLNGMRDLVTAAFINVDNLRQKVGQGRYDIKGADGDIILPSLWEAVAKPGMSFSMELHPPDAFAGASSLNIPPFIPPPPSSIPLPRFMSSTLQKKSGSNKARIPLPAPPQQPVRDVVYGLIPPPPAPPPAPVVLRKDSIGPDGGDPAVTSAKGKESRTRSRSRERDRQDSRERTSRYANVPRPRPGVRRAPTGFATYLEMVKQLSRHMPHLTTCLHDTDCRNPDAGKLSCWDTGLLGGPPVCTKQLGPAEFRPGSRAVSSLGTDIGPDVASRTIIVEDLTPDLIESLGSAFWLNPEFFEEHLAGAGYDGADYQGKPLQDWNTNATPKDYISLKWHRPVYRNWIKPHSRADRAALLDLDIGLVEWAAVTVVEDTDSIAASESEVVEHAISIGSNIFRECWTLHTDPATVEPSVTESRAAVWEERATIYRLRTKSGCPLFIVLLDPLPEIDHIEEERWAVQPRITTTIPFVQAYNRNSVGPCSHRAGYFGRKKMGRRRLNRLGTQLNSTSSTQDDLLTWLTEASSLTPDSPDLTIQTALLWVIHRDITGFLHFVAKVLEEIGLGSTDDYLMQARLAHWRGLIGRFQVELPELRRSFESFAALLSENQDAGIINEFVPPTLLLLDALIEQNEKSYAALRADIAVLESKRGIAEAESVSKITELAFVFIPLTFVSGIFSMQIKELETPAPVYAFIIAALTTVLLAYALRLAVRSDSVLQWKRNRWEKIRKDQSLAPGSNIPARFFVRYALVHAFVSTRQMMLSMTPAWAKRIERRNANRILFPVILVTACAAFITPILPVWAHHALDVGFKAIVTVLICLFVVLPVVVAACGQISNKRIAVRMVLGRRLLTSISSGSRYHTSNTPSSASSIPHYAGSRISQPRSSSSGSSRRKWFVPQELRSWRLVYKAMRVLRVVPSAIRHHTSRLRRRRVVIERDDVELSEVNHSSATTDEQQSQKQGSGIASNKSSSVQGQS